MSNKMEQEGIRIPRKTMEFTASKGIMEKDKIPQIDPPEQILSIDPSYRTDEIDYTSIYIHSHPPRKEEEEKSRGHEIEPGAGEENIQESIIVVQKPTISEPFLQKPDNPHHISKLDYYDGFLSKQSNKLLSSSKWTIKFCKIEKETFIIYKSLETGQISVALPFQRVKCEMTIEYKLKQFRIKAFLTSSVCKTYTFAAVNSHELNNWVIILSNLITKFRTSNFLKLEPKDEIYWKFFLIPIDFFNERANTGDILLFTSSNMGAKAQRFITGSKYDHVGLILRSSAKQIYFIDATSNAGVGVFEWKDFILKKLYASYKRVVYRPLTFKRDKEMLKNLEKYLYKANGKKYCFSPFSLFQKYSNMDSVANVEIKQGYFCSELIATIFKVLCILPKEIKSSQYLPGSFSTENKLNLINNAMLEDEYLIEFE